MGSGTTAIASLMTDRNFVGYEINDKYCKIIDERFMEFLNSSSLFFTGNKPKIVYLDKELK